MDHSTVAAPSETGKPDGQLSPFDRWDAVLAFQGALTGSEAKVLNALARRDGHGPGNLRLGRNEIATSAGLALKAADSALTGLRRKGIITNRQQGRGYVATYTVH